VIRHRLRKLVIPACLVGALSALAAGIVPASRFFNEVLSDLYLGRYTERAVIHYVESHEGNWPPDWESLVPYFDCDAKYPGRCRARVEVEFGPKAQEVRDEFVAGIQPRTRLIRLRYHKWWHAWWGTGFYNDDLLYMLRLRGREAHEKG